jgi:hypothetical protein
MSGAYGSNGGTEEVHIVLFWENLIEEPFGRPRHKWEDNMKMDFKEVGWGHDLD